MKNRVYFFRIVAFVLCFFMIINTMSCIKNDDEKTFENLVENAYVPEYIEIPDISENEYITINRVHKACDDLYFDISFTKYIDEKAGIYENGRKLYSIDIDNKTAKLVKTIINPRQQTLNDAKYGNYENVLALAVSDNHDILYVKEFSFTDRSDENNYIHNSDIILFCENSNGEIVFETSITEASAGLENVYISKILCFENEYIVISDVAAFFVSQSGEVVDVIELSDFGDVLQNIEVFPSGEIVGLIVNIEPESEERKFIKYDKEKKSFVDVATFSGEPYSFFAGEGDLVYYNTVSNAYVYNIATGKRKEIINFLNSDLNSNNSAIFFKSGDMFIAYEYSDDWASGKIVLLRQKADYSDKKIIKYASCRLNENMQESFIRFNKTSDEYRIVFTDYSERLTDENRDVLEILDQDIMTGNIPDIFNIEGLPIEKYIDSSLLADFSLFMDEDAEFKKEEYLENILNITSKDGKIYSMIPAFAVNTFLTQKKYVGEDMKISSEDFLNLLDEYPDSYIFPYYTTRKEVLAGFISRPYISHLMDTDGFNNEHFINHLEFAKALPEEFDWDKFQTENPDFDDMKMYRNGMTLMQQMVLTTFDVGHTVGQHGDDYCYAAFDLPYAESSGFSIIPEVEIVMFESSSNKEGAWEFIKLLYDDDFQRKAYNFPVKKSILEENVLKLFTDWSSVNQTNEAVENGEVYFGIFQPYQLITFEFGDITTYFTRGDINKIYDVLNACDFVSRSYDNVNKIIEEASLDFFKGEKTGEETACEIDLKVKEISFK